MITNGNKIQHYIGGPCRHGNVAPRRVSDRKCTCQQCSKSKAERSKARKQRWHVANAEVVNERSRRWHAANREKKNERQNAWRAKNRADKIAGDQFRRALKRRAVPSWFGEFDRLAVREAADLCRRRAAATGFSWQIDHAIPLQAREACGLHVGVNLQVIPARLNSGKSNRLVLTRPGEWIGAA